MATSDDLDNLDGIPVDGDLVMTAGDSLDDIDPNSPVFTIDFDLDEDGNADFHNHRGINLDTPIASTDVANKQYVDDNAVGGSGIPNGGTTGQILTKESSTDGDADWEDPTPGADGAILESDLLIQGDSPLTNALWALAPVGYSVFLSGQVTASENGLYVTDGTTTISRNPDLPALLTVTTIIHFKLIAATFADVGVNFSGGITSLFPEGFNFGASTFSAYNYAINVWGSRVNIDNSVFLSGHLSALDIDNVQELAVAVDQLDIPANLTAYNNATSGLTYNNVQGAIDQIADPSDVYTPTNVTPDRAFDADSTSTAELADVLGTLIGDLKDRKIIG